MRVPTRQSTPSRAQSRQHHLCFLPRHPLLPRSRPARLLITTSGLPHESHLLPYAQLLLFALRTCHTCPKPPCLSLQEEQAKRRWGATPEYQAYRESTNLLIPIPKSLFTGAACCPSKGQ